MHFGTMVAVSSEIRVLIADDHAIVREGIRAVIAAQPDFVVVGEAENGEQAWPRARELQPQVVVLDLSMPVMGGAEAVKRIASECPDVKVVALTMHEERGYVSQLLRFGAAGYVLKRTASSELVRAIRAVVQGELIVDSSLAGGLLAEQAGHPVRRDNPPAAGAPRLTGREREVLRLLAFGYSNKEVAATLSISVKTVETHRASGMTRLGVTNRAALVRFAMSEGWLSDN